MVMVKKFVEEGYEHLSPPMNAGDAFIEFLTRRGCETRLIDEVSSFH